MKPGRVPIEGAHRRDRVELALMLLYAMTVDVDELIVRNAQAMDRALCVCPVLEPAQERLSEIRSDIELMQRELHGVWRDGQNVRWQLPVAG